MDLDAYLVKRGWKFEASTHEGDSVFVSYWRFYNTKGYAISEVASRMTVGERPLLDYSTLLRPAFDDIHTDIQFVPMEVIGSNNSDGMRTFYRDSKYQVTLLVRPEPGDFGYHITVQEHGLTKAYTKGDDGKLHPNWIRMPPMTKAQKRYYDAFADSVERRNKALRAEAPTKKLRK